MKAIEMGKEIQDAAEIQSSFDGLASASHWKLLVVDLGR